MTVICKATNHLAFPWRSFQTKLLSQRLTNVETVFDWNKLSDPAEYWNNYLSLNFPHFWLVANSNPVGFSDFKDFMQKIWASLGLIVKYILIFRDIFVPLCAFVLFLHSFSLITRTIKTDMPFHILSYSLKIHSTLELIVITKSSQNGVDLQRYLSFQSFLWIFWRGIRTFLH